MPGWDLQGLAALATPMYLAPTDPVFERLGGGVRGVLSGACVRTPVCDTLPRLWPVDPTCGSSRTPLLPPDETRVQCV